MKIVFVVLKKGENMAGVIRFNQPYERCFGELKNNLIT